MNTTVRVLASTGVSLLVVILLTGTATPPAQASSSAIAYDMVGSASQNLVSFTDDPAIPFTSAADGFNKFQRGVSSTIPFAVLDDSAGTFPARYPGNHQSRGHRRILRHCGHKQRRYRRPGRRCDLGF